MKGKKTAHAFERKIYLMRGERVMVDKDLAELYEVPTKVLLQAVKRNRKRFPGDFMFQLKKDEYRNLRSQFVTSSWGGRRYLPFAFTEHGVGMLSSVLKSERAIQVNIAIIRNFIQLRKMSYVYKEVAQKIEELEQKVGQHDKEIRSIFEVIRQLMAEPVKPKPRIGFSKQ